MTPQEQQMIDGLISRIRSTAIQDKDTQAEQHIQSSLSGYPDALYVLVQTVLVQQYGLEQAQSQLRELKQQVQTLQNQPHDQPKSSSGSFLSHIFGGGNSSQPSQPQYQPVNNPGYGAQQGYPPPPPAYPPQSYPTQQGGGMFGGGMFGGGMFGGGGGGGGFLQGAMQTAAGVAAGEMVFRGMEDLFHGFGGQERGFTGGGGETVVNNYYDDDRSGGREDADRDRDRNDSGFYNPDNDASRSDSTQNFSDGATDNFSDAGSDDLSTDDSSSDTGGFDDAGGDDFSTDNS